MKREFSSGGIVFKNAGDKLWVLLVQNYKISRPEEYWWGFPKGHLEEGETSQIAALREVEEETGIKAEIVYKAGESKYLIQINGEKIFKIVILFAMNYLSGEPKPQVSEIKAVEWVEVEQALKILNFQNDKRLLNEALKLKEKNND